MLFPVENSHFGSPKQILVLFAKWEAKIFPVGQQKFLAEKSLGGILPPAYYATAVRYRSFNAFFTKLSDIHNYDTRNKSNYNPTRNKKVFADKAIRTLGPILWNSLDKNIKKSNLTKHFRKLYKSSLISNYI